ncbi:MAG: hypothetical protein WA817_19925 [Candidatus Acidiferrum sp.]
MSPFVGVIVGLADIFHYGLIVHSASWFHNKLPLTKALINKKCKARGMIELLGGKQTTGCGNVFVFA